MNKYLIINADDLNHSEAINNSIQIGIDVGIISSVSVIVNREVLKSTREIIKKNPQLSIGLHFNLSRYKPVVLPRRVPSLLINDSFSLGESRSAFFERANNFNFNEIEDELHAQVQRFIHCFGRIPEHIDSHHYVHSISPVREVVIKYSKYNNYAIRRPDRPGYFYKGELSMLLTTDRLIFTKWEKIKNIDNLSTLFESVESGWTEILCHADTLNSVLLRNINSQGYTNHYISFKVSQLLERHEIHLTNYLSLAEERNV